MSSLMLLTISSIAIGIESQPPKSLSKSIPAAKIVVGIVFALNGVLVVVLALARIESPPLC